MISTGDHFIPKGASSRWPFLIGTSDAYRPAPWNSHLLLWRGLIEAIFRAHPTQLRENWDRIPRERLTAYMHTEGAGKEHPSRAYIASLIRSDESVLDVGCGAGASYEVLSSAGKGRGYVGVDSSHNSIGVARDLYPDGDFRVGQATAVNSQFGPQSFDVVIVRHVLEHLPDFELAMQQAILVSRRIAIFVFFLTPRSLPFQVRKINPRIERHLFTNIYSKRAIEDFLTKLNLHWQWRYNIGKSRAGWLGGETNSVLIVSRNLLSGSET